MRVRPTTGTFAWLLAHELRLNWRSLEFSAAWRTAGIVAFLIYILVGFGLAIWLIDEPFSVDASYLISVLFLGLGLFTFNLSSALRTSQSTLFESGDLELLLSSPIPPRRVILTKLAGISLSVLMFNVLFIFPLVVPVALLGHPALFGLVVVIIAIAAFASCMGLGLTLLIVGISGPLASRRIIQFLAAVVGAAVFVISQVLGPSAGGEKSTADRFYDWCLAHGVGINGVTSLPGKAAFGDPLAIGVVVVSTVALLWITAWLVQTQFLRSYQIAGNKISHKKISGQPIAAQFSNSLRFVILRKELLLLVRDPVLIFETLFQLVYLAPMIFVLAKITGNAGLLASKLPVAAMVSVYGAGQLLASITNLTVFAEDAPDLLAVSPHAAKELNRWKLFAALVIGTPLILIIPLLMLTISVAAAAITFVATATAGCLAAFIELKLFKPKARRKFARRRVGSITAFVLTLGMSLALGGLCAYLVFLYGL